MDKKICPLMSRPFLVHEAHKQEPQLVDMVDCQEDKCAWWISTHHGGCAIVTIAITNDNGEVVI